MASELTFALDVSRWVDKAKGRVGIVIRKIALELLRRIVMKTPVDTGRLRGNWQLSIDDLVNAYDWNLTDQNGSNTVARGYAVLKDASDSMNGKAIWIANHLPYAIAIEYGWSTEKAPQGMVRVSLQEITGESWGVDVTEAVSF